MSGRKRLAVAFCCAAAGAYALDRITKLLAERKLMPRARPVEVIPGVLRLRYTTNSGGAFGVFAGQPWILFAASVLVCVGIVLSIRRLASAWTAVGLGLILGGALGNLPDRVIRAPGGFSGRVVDFIDFRDCPVFNLAESAIVVGAFLVAVVSFRKAS